MKYAFFDLDGTLIPVDSSILWAETLLSHVGKDEKSFAPNEFNTTSTIKTAASISINSKILK